MELHLLAKLTDELRIHGAEIISPAGSDVACNRRYVVVLQRVGEGWHHPAAHQDLADHIILQREEAVLPEARPGTAKAVLAVAGETAGIHVDLPATFDLGLIRGRVRAAGGEQNGAEYDRQLTRARLPSHDKPHR